MANYRYSHLYTTKKGDAAIQAASLMLNQGEIALAVSDGDEKLFYKNNNSEVVTVPTEEQINSRLGGISFVKITQSAYDDLVSSGTVDQNTLYIITD